jgi:trk system potassium uptake protein TrkH
MWGISGMPWPTVVHHAPLLAFSAQSTAGFSTLDLSKLDATAKSALILAMVVGGGVGSTGGGFKILRLLIVVQLLRMAMVRMSVTKHTVLQPRLAGQRLVEAEIQDAFLIIMLFITVIVISWLPFIFMGYDPLDALFEVVSATGTVGLSAGVVGAELPGILKGVLCADMLMGRLEIMAWLVLFGPKTWIGRRMAAS